MRNMRTLPQYAALVNPVLPVCYVTDLRKQHGRGVSEQVESCLDCLDMGTAVLLAGLTRALVATALAEGRQGTPPPAAPARWVDAALTAAARHGLAGAAVDPFTGRPADARSLRSRLLGHVQAALSARGDTEHITTLVHRLDHLGTGADRQRALFAAAGPAPEFVQALARARYPAAGTIPAQDPGGHQGA
jgi:gamma-glutamyl:cysteine ligase YbdK (ATP-grasp superfamily)